MVTFLAQGILVNVNNFMHVRNEFKLISLAYHIVITYIYCILCYNYLYLLTWRVHSLPTVGIVNSGIRSCCLGHAGCWAVVVLLCCSAPKALGVRCLSINHWSWRLQKASGNSHWKINRLSLLKKDREWIHPISQLLFLSSFLGACPSSVLSKSLNVISGRNCMVYSEFYCLPLTRTSLLAPGFMIPSMYKSYCLLFPSWLLSFFFQNTLMSLEDVLALVVEFGSLEAPNNLWY